jgi:argininosuccinate lyase
MAQLWGGRFTKETDALVKQFNDSLPFDRRLYRQDIRGSIAHAAMLGKTGILTQEERDAVIKGLEGILADLESGALEFSDQYEDIHSFVEANLIDRIGDAGKKLHTGRSRNDQVALDMKLYTRRKTREIREHLYTLLDTILGLMEENTDTYMPGFTHLQKAQPVTLAHHLGAYTEMFLRDRDRLHDIHRRMNTCPLGAGALAGTTYPLDRSFCARLLGFEELARDHAATYTQSLLAIKKLAPLLSGEEQKTVLEVQKSIEKGGVSALCTYLKLKVGVGKWQRTMSRALVLLSGRYRKYILKD